MLSRELCTKLINAGFPANVGKCSFCDVSFPTLSELINECGDGFINLYKFNNIWQTNFSDGMAGETAGYSPEEAVAQLYLAIQKK